MIKHRTFVILLMLLVIVPFAVTACGEEDESNSAELEYVSPRAAYEQSVQDDNAILVDVRTPQEWVDISPPADALLITWDGKNLDTAQLPEDANIYLVCNSGNRSADAGNRLIELGYDSVYSVEGGIQVWPSDLPRQFYTP
jgi:rhodanese-related sulfurtransferase